MYIGTYVKCQNFLQQSSMISMSKGLAKDYVLSFHIHHFWLRVTSYLRKLTLVVQLGCRNGNWNVTDYIINNNVWSNGNGNGNWVIN